MREEQSLVADTLAATVDELCLKFGVRKTAFALFLAGWRHQKTVNQTSHLSNRMRQDIGLPEGEETCGFSVLNFRSW
ncbi:MULTISPECIES: DUF1127 domain-containing protein [Rhizobium]|uniref:DUF1127 domain-containing protein n=1 Tax=Rhizobium paranaense TaxID=1650438 RepID=A0A7W8XSR8_9HYPH|nr:DUF1127 domain-containing protein [Rhizobium paranaense]MBB5574898.1 hypothetical protein [Rhizobium paranaense]